MDNWEKVFITKLAHQAEIVKAVLEDHQINAIIINKRDSAHAGGIYMGNHEVYVHQEQAEAASNLVKNDIKFE